MWCVSGRRSEGGRGREVGATQRSTDPLGEWVGRSGSRSGSRSGGRAGVRVVRCVWEVTKEGGKRTRRGDDDGGDGESGEYVLLLCVG